MGLRGRGAGDGSAQQATPDDPARRKNLVSRTGDAHRARHHGGVRRTRRANEGGQDGHGQHHSRTHGMGTSSTPFTRAPSRADDHCGGTAAGLLAQETRRREHQADPPFRGLMKAAGSCFARFAARFSLIDDWAIFFAPCACGDLPDMRTRFPSLAGGEPPTIATFQRKSTRGESGSATVPREASLFATAPWRRTRA